MARPRAPFARLFLVTTALGTLGALIACRSPGTMRPGAVEAAGAADASAPLAVGPAQTDSAETALLPDEAPTGKLVPFRDEAEVTAFAERWKEAEQEKQRPKTRVFPMHGSPDGGAPVVTTTPAKPASPPAAAPASSAAAESAARGRAATESRRDSKAPSESITNNQHAEVDEGDIVKLHGDHLVVLRRGRLFTLSLANGQLVRSNVLDAFGPDIDPRGAWYDEMVVEGDHVVVVGYSYQRGGTEIGLFRIDDKGALTYRATYHLKSNDYYSARNYASRIVDGRLVFYAPLYLSAFSSDLLSRFPAVRRWRKGAKDTEFVRTLVPSRLYHLEGEIPTSSYAALHTVTSCDLRTPELACESIGVVGPPGRVFYVSPSNVYVWSQDWAHSPQNEGGPSGLLARLPIGRSKVPVTAVRVAGMPTDQFSFEEDETGTLDVLVRSQSNGDAMFLSEHTQGAMALVRVPERLFGTGVATVSSSRYRMLPRPDGYSVQNRFVGPWLLYGAGRGYVTDHKGEGQLYAVRYASKDEPTMIRLDQGIERIEPMADDAVVVGSRGQDLVFTPVALEKEARARRDFVRKDAAQGEMRSHGFFYKPTSGKTREGFVGLPIRSPGAAHGRSYLLEGSASVLFLAHKDLELSSVGSLSASPLATNHDGCRASCVDWYGNARPIFAKGRVFALMGYELVEGSLTGTGSSARLSEQRRLSFAPRGGPPAAGEWD